MAHFLGLTVATVMQMSVAEYEGWIEWSKRRAEADRTRNKGR